MTSPTLTIDTDSDAGAWRDALLFPPFAGQSPVPAPSGGSLPDDSTTLRRGNPVCASFHAGEVSDA